MREREREPGSAARMPKIDPSDIELDKTRDGCYWRVLHWLDNDVVLQLRIGHTNCGDPDDFIAEVKLVGADDPAGRAEDGFVILAEFMYSPFELEDAEPDLEEFPDVFRAEFVTMMRHWGRALEIMECGAALGPISEQPCSKGHGRNDV